MRSNCENSGGFDRYRKVMVDWAQSVIFPHGYDPTPISLPQREQTYFDRLFRGFMEISNAIDSIVFCRTLIDTAPPRSKKIDKGQYLDFVVTTYLNEIYILQTRIFSYIKVCRKIYNKHENRDSMFLAFEAIDTYVSNSLNGLCTTRGLHVHESRFTDEGMDRLKMSSFVSKQSNDDDFRGWADQEYEFNKRRWSQIMKRNEVTINELLDTIFDIFCEQITTDTGPLKPHPSYQI